MSVVSGQYPVVSKLYVNSSILYTLFPDYYLTDYCLLDTDY